LSIRYWISRRAVSCEHFPIFAQFVEGAFPRTHRAFYLGPAVAAYWSLYLEASPRTAPCADGGQGRFGRVQSVVKAVQKPLHPGRNVERSSPAGFAPTCCESAARLFSDFVRSQSAIARAMRPLPSSNGRMVTNHECASGNRKARRSEPLTARTVLTSSPKRQRRRRDTSLFACTPMYPIPPLGGHWRVIKPGRNPRTSTKFPWENSRKRLRRVTRYLGSLRARCAGRRQTSQAFHDIRAGRPVVGWRPIRRFSVA